MRKIVSILAFSALTAVAATPEHVRPSRLIINTFGGQCPHVIPRSVGSSLVNLNSLYGVVEELKNTNECNGMEQISNVLSSYSGIVQNFSTKESESQQQLVLEKKIALYSQMLSNPTLTPSQISYVQDQIIQAQTSLVNIKAGLTRFQNFSGRESRGANQLLKSLDGFLSNTLANQGNACYQKKPAQVTNLISNVLLTAAAFAAPGASLALAAAGVVTSTVGKYVVDFKYNRALTNINDAEMPLALRCVSEVLTEQYCSARETIDLINERIDNQNSASTKYDGINLLSFQLNKLSTWLEAIHAGSSITSEGDLINREKAIKQGVLLEQIKRAIEAYTAQQEAILQNTTNEIERSKTISNSIQFIVSIMSSGNINGYNMYGPTSLPENPLFRAISSNLMPYEIYKRGEFSTVPLCGQNSCSSLTDYIAYYQKPLLGISDWDQALKNTLDLVTTSIRITNEARAKTVSVDARTILADATRTFTGDTNAYNALVKIKRNAIRISKYLTDHITESNDYQGQLSNINKTMLLSQQVITLIDEAFIPRTTPEESTPTECRIGKNPFTPDELSDDDVLLEKKSFQITSCISKILKLEERGTDVFFTKVRNMVSYEMEARFLHKDLGEGAIDLINSTKDDLVKTILNSYSSPDSSMSVGQVKGSLEESQKVSKDTLDQFFGFFKSDLLNALKDPKITGFSKNDLCFRILPYLDESKKSLLKDVYTACSSAVLQEYKNGPIIRFTDYIQRIPGHGIHREKFVLVNPDAIADRYCGYSKYNQANQLVELQKEQMIRQLNLNTQFNKMRIKFDVRN